MTRGYIRLWRKTIDDAVFQDACLFKVFAWCLLRANHRVVSVQVATGRGHTIVTLNPGQLIFGRHSAARELRMPPSSIRNRLEVLKKLQILDIKVDTHYSIITVINWQSYQSDSNEEGQAKDRQTPKIRTGNRTGKLTEDTSINTGSYEEDETQLGQATGQANSEKLDTDKNIYKKKIYGDFVLLTDDEYQKLVSRFGEQGTKDRIEALNNGIGSKGYRYKSHYHTILSWERKNQKPNIKAPLGGLAY